jgi:hypothetical protein
VLRPALTLANGPFSSQTLNFAFYLVDASTLVFISLPIISGTMGLQVALAADGNVFGI